MSLVIVRIIESKIGKARILRTERNMKERGGGEMAGTVDLDPLPPDSFPSSFK